MVDKLFLKLLLPDLLQFHFPLDLSLQAGLLCLLGLIFGPLLLVMLLKQSLILLLLPQDALHSLLVLELLLGGGLGRRLIELG